MNISSKILNVLLILLLPVGFVSCGANDYAGGGIGGTGISVGKITAFGSVWVNGIEFDTTGAQIIKDGVSVLEVVTDDKEEPPTYLRRGMIVIVRGEFNLDGKRGTASSIEFRDNLEGPISAVSINLVNQTFEVLGQTIKVDEVTVFEGTTDLSTLVDGNIIEVSGFVDANGVIHATYISLKAGSIVEYGSDIELKGTITALNEIPGTFKIGGLTIGFSSFDTTFEHMTISDLQDGLYVEVKSTTGVSGNVLIASEIELEEKGHHVEVGHEFEVEGYVTFVESVLIDGMFELEGQSVQITSNTIFENGASVADIVVDVKIEVEGKVDAFGVLIADKIKIKSGDDGDSDDSSESDHVENGENDPS